MKGLSLWQPWASLIAVGAKKIETRSWPTSYRGPILIHAAKTTNGFDLIASGTEAGWRYTDMLPGYQAAYCYTTSDEGVRGDTYLHDLRENLPGPCPLGAAVATAILVDCIPIVGKRPSIVDTPAGKWIQETAATNGDFGSRLILHESDGLYLSSRPLKECADYGDYTPGRFAWVLVSIEALAEPIPMKGRQGLWNVDPAVLSR